MWSKCVWVLSDRIFEIIEGVNIVVELNGWKFFWEIIVLESFVYFKLYILIIFICDWLEEKCNLK